MILLSVRGLRPLALFCSLAGALEASSVATCSITNPVGIALQSAGPLNCLAEDSGSLALAGAGAGYGVQSAGTRGYNTVEVIEDVQAAVAPIRVTRINTISAASLSFSDTRTLSAAVNGPSEIGYIQFSPLDLATPGGNLSLTLDRDFGADPNPNVICMNGKCSYSNVFGTGQLVPFDLSLPITFTVNGSTSATINSTDAFQDLSYSDASDYGRIGYGFRLFAPDGVTEVYPGGMEPAPEPATWGLFGFSCAGWVFYRKSKRR